MFQNPAGAACCLGKFRCPICRHTAFKHRDIMIGMFARKGEVGTASGLKRRKGRGLILVIGVLHEIRKHQEPLSRGLGNQILSPFEMAIDGSRGDAGLLGGLR